MAGIRQILFIQGGGAGVHDEWDDKLVDSLRQELGNGYEVRYPVMPGEDDPSYAGWGTAIRRAMAALDDGAIVAGHSVGGTLLMNVLSAGLPERRVGAAVLISAPFVGVGGWPGFELPPDLGARLPQSMPVHVFHGLEDDTVPPSHAELYARVIPQARLHLLPGRDHQLGDDLTEVARAIRLTSFPSSLVDGDKPRDPADRP